MVIPDCNDWGGSRDCLHRPSLSVSRSSMLDLEQHSTGHVVGLPCIAGMHLCKYRMLLARAKSLLSSE